MAKDKLIGGTQVEEIDQSTDEKDTSIRKAITEALDAEETEEVAEAPEEEEAKAEKAEKVETEPEEEPEPDEEPDEPDEIEAPAHWALEDQELFRKQPVEVQKYLLGRHKSMEADYTKKSQEVAPFRKAIEPWQPYLKSLNVTPEHAFNMLMTAQYQLQTGSPEQKKQALLKIAKDYDISLETGKPAEKTDDVFASEVNRVLAPIRDELGQLKTSVLTREQQAAAAQQTQAEQTVQSFRDAKTEAGQPAHPYFSEVEEDMIRLAQADQMAGRTPDLTDLYERAVWANPTVRAKLQAAQQHAARKQEEKRRKEEVQKAKKASVSVSGGPSGSREQPKSLRDELAAAFEATS